MSNLKKSPEPENRGVTVGTFDGVHSGHREVVDYLRRECESRAIRPMVITFTPHPLEVVAPGKAPKLLETVGERVRRLEEMGVEVMLLPFTEELRKMTVDEWLKDLAGRYNVKLLVAGYDNKFGSDGMGMTVGDYARLGAPYGIETLEAPVVDGVSSSLVREALAAGEVEKASAMLGYVFSVEGDVVDGRHLGRELGFPTANLHFEEKLAIPKPGVYAARAVLPDGEDFSAVVNIGVAPTAGAGLPLTVEAHLIGFKGNLYGKRLRLEFLRRLRDEKKFDSLEELKAGIASDVEKAAGIMESCGVMSLSAELCHNSDR